MARQGITWYGTARQQGAHFIVSSLWRKIGNFTYRMVKKQGETATDGGFRSHAARMPPAPTRPP